jgi:hypothetical protein
VGDFNEPFGNDPDGMPKLAAAFQLIELMAAHHSSSPPATYAKGRTRLDYALATDPVADALAEQGMHLSTLAFTPIIALTFSTSIPQPC